MTQSEEDILTALIMQLAKGYYSSGGTGREAPVSERTARIAARKILEVGFSMARRPVDERQDQEIDALETAIEQLRGWAGLPPELRRVL